MSCPHVSRTVRYLPSVCLRPDESIASEEMSVYDIKDHADYKFRPGHVVVRVGGLEVRAEGE